MTTALERLTAGYWNADLKTLANPGGLTGPGAVRLNWPLVLADIAEVAEDAGAAAVLTAAMAAQFANSPATIGASATPMSISAAGTVLNPVLSAGKAWVPGMQLLFPRDPPNQATRFLARLDAYDPVTGASTVTVAASEGAGGPFNDWSVSVTAPPMNTATDTFNVTKNLRLTGEIAPAALAADQNDWNPAGLAAAAVVKASGTADRTVTGLAAGGLGDLKILENTGAYNLTLAAQSAASAAANRFDLATDLVVRAKQLVLLRYDGAASRWRVMGVTAATAAEIRAGSGAHAFMTAPEMYAALAEVALAYSGANIVTAGDAAPDLSKFYNAAITITQNSTLPNPTNAPPGKSGRIRFTVGGAGGYTLACGGNWDFEDNLAPTIPSSVGAVFYLDFDVVSASIIRARVSRVWG